MSEQRKVPKLRFPEFTEDWEQRKLSELGEIVTGSTPSTSKSEYYSDTGIPWVTPTDIESNVISKTQKKLSEAGAKVGRIVPANTILCTCIASIGKNALLTEKGSFNQQINSLTPNANNDAYFLLTESEIWSNQMKRRAASGTMQIVNKSEFSELVTMVPKFEEQKKIGSFFSCLDNLITLHQRKCDVLKKLKKGLLQKMFPKDGTNIPEIRFPEFTDAWEQRKLGDIGSARSGVGFPDAEQGGIEGIPFFKVSDMNNVGNENELVSANNYVSDEQIKRKRWNVITDVPAIFFAKVGAAVMLNRKRLVRFPFLLDNNTMAYIFDKKTWDCDFGKTLFETIDLTKLTQTGALPSYNASDVEDIEIYLPNIEEQKAIGAFFLQLDNLITLHQRKCDVLKKLKQGLLQKMFPKDGTNIPEIRFPEFTDAWEQRKLGDLGTTYTGLSGKTSSDFGHGEARFVTYMNVYSNPVANPNMIEPVEIDKKQNEVNVGDVFFTTSSETPEEVGMSSVLLEKQGHLYLNSFCFGYRPKQKIDPYYLAFMLRSEPVRKKIIFLAQGISRYNISKNKMMEICVPLPSLGEQKKIGNFCKNLDELITLHQRKLEVLKKLKKGLLQQMFV